MSEFRSRLAEVQLYKFERHVYRACVNWGGEGGHMGDRSLSLEPVSEMLLDPPVCARGVGLLYWGSGGSWAGSAGDVVCVGVCM